MEVCYQMEIRKTIKKMVALGTGMTMVGATIFGAAAASLADYPSPLFIKDGQFDGVIVVGDQAAASDVVGSIDIAAALQAESVVEEAAGSGTGLYKGGIGRVVTTGDVAEMTQPNDLLEIQELVGDVRQVLTELDLNALRGGVVTTDEGTTDYNQYLRFEDTGSSSPFNSSLRVAYDQDEDDNVGDFLFSPHTRTDIMFEWEMEFEEGAESTIQSTTELDDLEDEIINILGTPFAIADTDISTGTSQLTLKLLGGAISDILEEGETKTYTINGKEYEVNVLIVSDNRNLVKFKINGEITDELRDGETDILKDGTRIGIREILPNEAEEVTGGDLVEFYLGATQVEFTDVVNDTAYQRSAEVNDENIEDGQVQMRGQFLSSNRKFELLTVKYRLNADTLLGDLYVPPGHGLREYLREPEGLLSPNWDLVYGGLVDSGTSILKFASQGDDQYNIRFTNAEGLNYNVEFLDNDDTTGFRVGDNDNKLVWIEPTNSSDRFVGQNDQFILTDDQDETGITHVVEYQAFDESDNLLTFVDLAGETREFTAKNESGQLRAELIFGGNTFTAEVGSTPNFNISLDLNGDGVFGDGQADTGANMGNQACQATGRLDNILGLSVNNTGGALSGIGGAAENRSVTTSDAVGPCRTTIVVQGGAILDLGVCDGNNAPGDSSLRTFASQVAGDNFTGRCMTNFNITGASGTAGAGTNPSFALTTLPSNLFQVGLKTLNSEFDESGPRDLGGDETVYVRFENRSNSELGLNLNGGVSRFPLRLNELKENDDIKRDMTDYGVLVELFDPSGSDRSEDLTFEYPLVQRGVHAFIVSGEYGIKASAAGGVTQRINRINVGVAKLASEVEDITAVNAIVVGGPCANAAAAALMGNPDDCAAGFEPGKALIKLFENQGNSAVLVAGYAADDTRRASRVLANHADYALSGDEVVVSGTSLTDIKVSAATP